MMSACLNNCQVLYDDYLKNWAKLSLARLYYRFISLFNCRCEILLETLQVLISMTFDLSDSIIAIYLDRHQLSISCNSFSSLSLFADLAASSELLLDLKELVSLFLETKLAIILTSSCIKDSLKAVASISRCTSLASNIATKSFCAIRSLPSDSTSSFFAANCAVIVNRSSSKS